MNRKIMFCSPLSVVFNYAFFLISYILIPISFRPAHLNFPHGANHSR
jgi:hypothetical protein